MESTHRVLGADGISRSPKEDEELNLIISALFRSRAGKRVLDYLRSITIEYVAGPNISDGELRHREGMRYLVGIIEERMRMGQK
jgi:hypothetical protein